MRKIILLFFIAVVFCCPQTLAEINISTHYNFSDSMNFSGNFPQYNNLSFEGHYESKPSFGLGIEYSEFFFDNFSYSIGGIIDFERKIPKGAITVDNQNPVTLKPGEPNPSLNLGLAYLNLIYFADRNQYVFAGLNYSVPSWEQGSALNDDIKMSGKVGYQAGYGYKISNLAIEVLYQYINIKAEQANINYNKTDFSGVRLNCKYLLI